MEIALIYATKHNHTKKVVDKLPVKVDVFNINEDFNLCMYELIIIFCPTYGDEELPLDMEYFLCNLNIRDKKFIVCELGNYYGYEDYNFGASKIIRYHLISLGWQEVIEGLSLDSLPKIDWPHYFKWCEKLIEYVNGNQTGL